jgi:hypothetical protein
MQGRGRGHWESPCGLRSPNGESLATWKPPFSPCTKRYAQGYTSALAVNEKNPTPTSNHISSLAHAAGQTYRAIAHACMSINISCILSCSESGIQLIASQSLELQEVPLLVWKTLPWQA